MKTCTKCKKKKRLSSFHNRTASKDGHSIWCKICHKANHKVYYQGHKTKWRNRNRAQRATTAKKLRTLKESKPCQDCKLFWPACVMDFDHRSPILKKFNIGTVVHNGGVSWKMVEQEIAKCDLVCSNCHRVRTHITNKRHSRRIR